VFPDRPANRLKDRQKPATPCLPSIPGFVRSAYVRLCVDSQRSVTSGLLDEIALAQRFVKAVAAEEFQAWKLTVKPDSTATLSCEDGNTNVVFTKEIEFTDFPCDEITLWFANDVILLPSEY